MFGGAGVAFGAPGTDFDGKRSFNKFTPRASRRLNRPRSYALRHYSQGFKGGGFDPRGVGSCARHRRQRHPSDAEIAAFLSFRPEQVESYEVGYKGSLMDGAVNVGIAGFYADYTDVQIPGSVACTVSGLPSFCGVVSNAGKATFKGVEFEGRLRLGEDLAAAGDRRCCRRALLHRPHKYVS